MLNIILPIYFIVAIILYSKLPHIKSSRRICFSFGWGVVLVMKTVLEGLVGIKEWYEDIVYEIKRGKKHVSDK